VNRMDGNGGPRTMLVLTRKPGQSIMIGDEIEVRVLAVTGEKVRIDITASKEVPVYREEIYERIVSERSSPEKELERLTQASGR
jgi:carbon storage regulator